MNWNRQNEWEAIKSDKKEEKCNSGVICDCYLREMRWSNGLHLASSGSANIVE